MNIIDLFKKYHSLNNLCIINNTTTNKFKKQKVQIIFWNKNYYYVYNNIIYFTKYNYENTALYIKYLNKNNNILFFNNNSTSNIYSESNYLYYYTRTKKHKYFSYKLQSGFKKQITYDLFGNIIYIQITSNYQFFVDIYFIYKNNNIYIKKNTFYNKNFSKNQYKLFIFGDTF